HQNQDRSPHWSTRWGEVFPQKETPEDRKRKTSDYYQNPNSDRQNPNSDGQNFDGDRPKHGDRPKPCRLDGEQIQTADNHRDRKDEKGHFVVASHFPPQLKDAIAYRLRFTRSKGHVRFGSKADIQHYPRQFPLYRSLVAGAFASLRRE